MTAANNRHGIGKVVIVRFKEKRSSVADKFLTVIRLDYAKQDNAFIIAARIEKFELRRFRKSVPNLKI